MMNPNDFEYQLSCEANREGHLGDFLQVFVHDFTLRQGAGEAKVREVENQIGGVMSELFILRKLLQDFQTRVNDDHDIIIRLQHEIEALHGRVRSLDSKQTAADTQSGQLNLRIEQLREQINQNCEDTQQNVSRLLGSFARVHLTRGSARSENFTSNNREARQDLSVKNDINYGSRQFPTQDMILSCHNETAANTVNPQSTVNSITSPETTFLHTATTEVSNEEYCVNDSCDNFAIGLSSMQPHPLCEGLTSREEGSVHGPSETISNNSALADNGYQTMQEVDSNGSINNDSFICSDIISNEETNHDESLSLCLAQDENQREETRDSIISDTHENVHQTSMAMEEHGACPTVNEVDKTLKTESISENLLQNSEISSVILEPSDDDKSKENIELLCNTISQETDKLPVEINSETSLKSCYEPSDNKKHKERPTCFNKEVYQAASGLNCEEIPQEKDYTSPEKILISSEPVNKESFNAAGAREASATAIRKIRPKRHRGRKRKDSQSTENQATLEDTTIPPASQSNSNSTSAIMCQAEEFCAAKEEEVCCQGDIVKEVQNQKLMYEHCILRDINWDSNQGENMLHHNVSSDNMDQCQSKQPSLQINEQKSMANNETLPKEPQNDQLEPVFTEFKPRQNIIPESEQQSTTVQNNIYETQCIQEMLEQDHPKDSTKCTQPVSFLSKEQADDRSKGLRPFNIKADSASPMTRRRAAFHSEIDDDEIPDLSDIDALKGEEKIAGNGSGRSNEERKAIEIKTPSGEITNLQTKRKPKPAEKRMETKEEEQKDEVVGICANCSNLAKLRCGNCRQAFYCQKECQKEHWKTGHKDQCRPYQVLESPDLGRYMVASRDLKAGDVILKEDPVVVGPKQITEPICLGCYRRVDGSYRCQKCHWPLCGPTCEKSPDHLPECVVGAEIGSPIEISSFDEPNHFYEVVFPLRCLALKKKSPKRYEQVIGLDSHYNDRKGTHVHMENQKSVVNMLRNYFLLHQFPIEDIDSSEKSIHNMMGVIDVNALEIRLPESEIHGIYPNFAMMEHSCTPNTKHSFSDSRQVVLKAAVDIKTGEHLSTMYTHILWGTLARRDHLKHSKYFMCTCFRCSDPTELGTNFSTLRCTSCINGFMLSAAPLDELADWICTSCNATIKSEEITDINLKLGEEVEGILAAPSVPILEELLQKHAKTTVHPNHFHLFATRHTLLQMYGREPAYANEDFMKKKERMCQDFLKVCTALDPGMSRLAPYAGVALYEYHLAVLSRTRINQDANQTDPAALKKDVETAKALLQQCIKVLQEEPRDQPEGQLCQVAQQNLIELRQWEANLFSS